MYFARITVETAECTIAVRKTLEHKDLLAGGVRASIEKQIHAVEAAAK